MLLGEYAADPRRVIRDAMVSLNIEQSQALLAVTTQDSHYGPVAALALLTESAHRKATGLQWQDIDWDRIIHRHSHALVP
jgi:hypothetical protein